jgi:hypothetical protein
MLSRRKFPHSFLNVDRGGVSFGSMAMLIAFLLISAISAFFVLNAGMNPLGMGNDIANSALQKSDAISSKAGINKSDNLTSQMSTILDNMRNQAQSSAAMSTPDSGIIYKPSK